MIRRLLVRSCAVFAVEMLLTGVSWAQTANPQSPDLAPAACPDSDPSAKALYDGGLLLLKAGRARDALPLLQHSYELLPCPRTLAQIASAEHAQQRWADAAAHLQTVLASGDPWVEERRETYLGQQKVLELRLRASGGRNEDPSLLPRPSAVSARSRLGLTLTIGGSMLGAAAVASMSVAQAFSGSVAGADFGMWTHGKQVYSTALPVGGILLAVGGTALIGGLALISLPRKEQQANPSGARLFAPSEGTQGLGLIRVGRSD